MKKSTLAFLALMVFAFLLSTLMGCVKKGDTMSYDVIIKQGNKSFKVKKVYLDDSGSNLIYVMYPLDSDSVSVITIPKTINHQRTSGDDTVHEAVVVLD